MYCKAFNQCAQKLKCLKESKTKGEESLELAAVAQDNASVHITQIAEAG